jgi:hypothetical protein
MERNPAAFAGRFAEVRELDRFAYASLGVAIDQTTGQPVAVRLLRSPRFARDPAAASELRDAATRAFQVSHRGIANPIDVEVEPERALAWVIFDPVPSLTLDDLRAPATAGRTRPLTALATLADSLIAARLTSAVHGTLHPKAVHLTSAGTVERTIVLDLELGPFIRVAALDAGVRDAPFFAYASPQILAAPASGGEPKDDVFSIAAMTYEVLAGQRPHLASSFDELARAWRDPPPDLRGAHFDVPLPLATLVMRSLSDDPRERPSMRELAAGLAAGAKAVAAREAQMVRRSLAPARDATVVVERADLEAALKNARLRSPERPPRRRVLGEGWVVGVAALSLAGFLSLAWGRDATEAGLLRLATRAKNRDGGIVPPVRVFVDGRFRGVVDRTESRDIAVSAGEHELVLRFDDGGVAASRRVVVGERTRLTVPVRALDVPDPVTVFRHEADNRFEVRCAGTWRGTLEPGHRAIAARIEPHPIDGRCGELDAGRMGSGPLESCAFDGETLLLAQVVLRSRTFAVRLECKPEGGVTLLEARAQGDLAREALTPDAAP